MFENLKNAFGGTNIFGNLIDKVAVNSLDELYRYLEKKNYKAVNITITRDKKMSYTFIHENGNEEINEITNFSDLLNKVKTMDLTLITK
jgi:hypothetical protein